jgi:hypothetical protein
MNPKQKSEHRQTDPVKTNLVVFFVIIFLIVVITTLCVCVPRVEHTSFKERENLLKSIQLFYEGFPSRGYYYDCLERVKMFCLGYLKHKAYVPERTIVVDFDDTIVYTKPYNPLSPKPYRENELYWHFPPIPQIIDVVSFAKSLEYIIIILSARYQRLLYDTITNTESFGIHADKYLLLGKASQKKPILHNLQKITKIDLGLMTLEDILEVHPNQVPAENHMNVVLTIGDQWDDLIANDYGSVGIKLPDPHDMNAYLWDKTKDKVQLI